MNDILILAILFGLIVLSEWLCQTTFLKQAGTALVVIIMGAIVANLGIIPSATNPAPLYKGIFTYIAPLSIFFLLLEVNIENVRKAGLPMLLLFVLGSFATAGGAIIGMSLIKNQAGFGEFTGALAGMFTGTYTGGSVNFNAVALHYKVMEEGVLFAGAVAVDNIMTAIWLVVCIGLPQIFRKRKVEVVSGQIEGDQLSLLPSDNETVNPKGISLLLMMGAFALWGSEYLAEKLALIGVDLPSIIYLTTIALVIAQMPFMKKLKGSRLLGLISVYLFLVVIGAYCELAALQGIGQIALYLLAFAFIMFVVHGLVVFGLAYVMKLDWDMVAVASQANIGGSSTALALAKTFERSDLLLPGILVGAIGNALGTYLGFLVAGMF